jgi:hypothetical protein
MIRKVRSRSNLDGAHLLHSSARRWPFPPEIGWYLPAYNKPLNPISRPQDDLVCYAVVRANTGAEGSNPSLSASSKSTTFLIALPRKLAAWRAGGRFALFRTLRVTLADCAKRAGCSDTSPISPNHLRHTSASEMHRCGSLPALMQLMGD